jgi:Fur family ferric uptake transcriptional regulator
MKSLEKKMLAALKQRGYKLTPQRQAVVRAILLSPYHLSPADIYEKVSQLYPGIGVVTVYRTLEILTRLGLICELHTGGDSRSYVVRESKEHHHHLICTGCGKVIYFTSCGLEKLSQRLSREVNFEIKTHLLEFFGRCHSCRGRKLT